MYKKQHIHFIGIGGIGMSGIAKILRVQGHTISGCDSDIDQPNIKELQKLGCEVYPQNNHENCHNNSIDIVVYTTAIKQDNPELLSAKQKDIPAIHRSIILSELMRMKNSIAVSGAHGKTTTTSLISHILIEAELDPTVIIGGNLRNINTNAISGSGDYLVAEADESDKSLLKLSPTLGVITNIDLEHLETYKDLDDIKTTYIEFLSKLPFYGKAFVWIDDANIQSILPYINRKVVKFGLNKDLADIYAYNIILNSDHSTFNLSINNQEINQEFYLNIPGKYNVLNALAAISVCLELGVNLNTISKALKSFLGVERRFNLIAFYKGAEFFDDYGHHPTEIDNALTVAKNRTKNKVITIFQPHKYSRTHKLWQDFVNTFIDNPVDHLIITDIFPAGEEPIENISSDKLIKDIQQASPSLKSIYIPLDHDFKLIHEYIDKIISPNDLVVLLGAGKINKLAYKISDKIS